jgi:hypothetical protein
MLLACHAMEYPPCFDCKKVTDSTKCLSAFRFQNAKESELQCITNPSQSRSDFFVNWCTTHEKNVSRSRYELPRSILKQIATRSSLSTQNNSINNCRCSNSFAFFQLPVSHTYTSYLKLSSPSLSSIRPTNLVNDYKKIHSPFGMRHLFWTYIWPWKVTRRGEWYIWICEYVWYHEWHIVIFNGLHLWDITMRSIFFWCIRYFWN